MQEFIGHTDDVASLQFDEVKLVSASKDGTIRFWDLRCASNSYLATITVPIGNVRLVPT